MLSTSQKDKKPFKGKGGADIPVRLVKWRESCFRKYEQITEEMRELSQYTKNNGGKSYYAMIHKRLDSANATQYALRWRSYGENAFHHKWDDIQVAISQMSPDMQAYFIEANLMMEYLNAEEQSLRASYKIANRMIERFEEVLQESILTLCIN